MSRNGTLACARFSELDLPSTTVFDYPTAEGLAEMIVIQLPPPPVVATPIRVGEIASPPVVEAAKSQAFVVPGFDGEPRQHDSTPAVESTPATSLQTIGQDPPSREQCDSFSCHPGPALFPLENKDTPPPRSAHHLSRSQDYRYMPADHWGSVKLRSTGNTCCTV